MRNKSIAPDKNFIQAFLQKKNKPGEQNPLVQYSQCNQVISFLKGLTDVSSYQHKLEELVRSGSYRKEVQQQQNVLQTESSMKQNYMQCFENKDLNWWKDEIARMRTIKSGPQETMYQRLLSYLSLASYSFSNNAIKQNNFSAAGQFLAIYKLADPENSEQPFLTACLYARQGDQGKAIAALQEAIQLGLKDKVKIETEESFRELHSNAEFNRLVNSL